jgi:hypothetical protein
MYVWMDAWAGDTLDENSRACYHSEFRMLRKNALHSKSGANLPISITSCVQISGIKYKI